MTKTKLSIYSLAISLMFLSSALDAMAFAPFLPLKIWWLAQSASETLKTGSNTQSTKQTTAYDPNGPGFEYARSIKKKLWSKRLRGVYSMGTTDCHYTSGAMTHKMTEDERKKSIFVRCIFMGVAPEQIETVKAILEFGRNHGKYDGVFIHIEPSEMARPH